MKKFIGIFLLLSVFCISVVSSAVVSGYVRSNGTYVNSYFRTSPDSVKWNNYSYKAPTFNYTPKTYTIPTTKYWWEIDE